MRKRAKFLIVGALTALTLLYSMVAFAPGVFSYASTAITCSNYLLQVQAKQEGGRTVNGSFVAAVTIGNWTTTFHRYLVYNFHRVDLTDAPRYLILNGQRFNASSADWGRRLPDGLRLNDTEAWLLPRGC